MHERGTLWRLVRASMTIVGLVPPVYHEGELLVDGGYLNNIPVDVMRGLGVDSVIVVDVEDKDASVWRNLSAYDGGISGWQLLWDRWCPIPSLRCAALQIWISSGVHQVGIRARGFRDLGHRRVHEEVWSSCCRPFEIHTQAQMGLFSHPYLLLASHSGFDWTAHSHLLCLAFKSSK